MKNRALQLILKSDPKRSIASLGFFSNYPVKEFIIENSSAIILGESDNLWAHLSSSSENELCILLEKFHTKTKFYFSIEDWMIPLILHYGTEDWILTTNRYILDNSINTEFPKSKTKAIDKSFASFMYENSEYKNYLSIEYINDQLDRDISAGIIMNDRLIAWGFTHDDGSLGFLHVIEEYRNKGYGLDILLSLIQMRKQDKKPIFANIIPDNLVSIKLVTKLGFELDRKTSWLKLK